MKVPVPMIPANGIGAAVIAVIILGMVIYRATYPAQPTNTQPSK